MWVCLQHPDNESKEINTVSNHHHLLPWPSKLSEVLSVHCAPSKTLHTRAGTGIGSVDVTNIFINIVSEVFFFGHLKQGVFGSHLHMFVYRNSIIN